MWYSNKYVFLTLIVSTVSELKMLALVVKPLLLV